MKLFNFSINNWQNYGKCSIDVCTSQQHDKCGFDTDDRGEPSFKVRDYVLVDYPQIDTIGTDAADAMAIRRYRSFRLASGPYEVLGVQRHIITIEKNRIPNSVSIDLRTRSPTREPTTDKLDETIHSTRQQNPNQQRQNAGKDAKRTNNVIRMYHWSTW